MNLVLFFTQPTIIGQKNPLFGVIFPLTLAALFSLHAYYARMRINNSIRLTASEQMRSLLPRTIERAVNAKGEALRIAIEERIAAGLDASNIELPEDNNEYFNPDNFSYLHFSKLITAGRIRFLAPEELEVLTPEVTRVYGPLFPDYPVIRPEMILQYQQKQVALARDYITRWILGNLLIEGIFLCYRWSMKFQRESR